MFLTALVVSAVHTRAQTTPIFNTLHSLSGTPSDGSHPYYSLAVDTSGVVYGTTGAGGTSSDGTVFSLTPPASGSEGPWTEIVLHSFTGGSDGADPTAGVTIGSGGVLYGTTHNGGTSNSGTVFSLTPPASGSGDRWTKAVLYDFPGGHRGVGPQGVVIGNGGVLYGTTFSGGTSGDGVVFSLTPPESPGGAWTEDVLYNFTGSEGTNPLAGVAIGTGGVLYGTTSDKTAVGAGTVFSLTPPATPGGSWTATVLYAFTGYFDGGKPYAPVAVATSGVLYGTTAAGGAICCGTVFSLTPPAAEGGAWTQAVLYSFSGGSDGGNPLAGVAIGPGGVLYGTTAQGGDASGDGTVFSLTPPAGPGGAWTEDVLHIFTGDSDGYRPDAGVVIGRPGALYGATYFGGPANDGTVFQVLP
jgi:uncharacterized repeat protein (TIGR03803 family)